LNQQFVENLIALRKHYQSLQEQIERDRAHAKQQLTHVDALLVDRLVSDQRLSASLIELRNQYQEVAAECERQSAHAREQLTHVNALLADQLVQQHTQLLSMEASTENKNRLLSGVADVTSGKSLKQTNESETEATALVDQPNEQEKVKESASKDVELIDTLFERRPQDGNAQTLELEEEDQADSPTDAADNTAPTPEMKSEPERESEESDDLDSDEAIVASEPESSQGASANGQATKERTTRKTPMLPQYQQMTKMQAIENLLRKNAGTILHIDYVIQAGSVLDPDEASKLLSSFL